MIRSKKDKKKKSIGISINIELNEQLEKYLEEKKLSRSEYIENLIKKDIDK